VTWSNQIRLTLGYDPTMPDGRDLATQIRTRLEDTGGMSVRLRAIDPTASTDLPDLMVLDRKAWTSTGLSWLQPYLQSPLPTSTSDVTELERQYREAGIGEEAVATRSMASLQRKAAADLVLLPLTQSDEYVFTAPKVEVPANSYGPGWQLGLWGMFRA
jgi:peptide/nickel transport system substrate-binding protein